MDKSLTHAGNQEDLVVHRQAKGQADEHDRQEGKKWLWVIDDAEHAFLEDSDGDAERGGH